MLLRRWRGGAAAIWVAALVDVGSGWCLRARHSVGRETLGHPELLP